MSRTEPTDHIEARNMRIAAAFEGLPDDLDPWRVRRIAEGAAPALGLSVGARAYLASQLALVGADAWRSPHPVAFRSLTRAALERGCSERQIARYEVEIIRAGMAFRAVKHGRRRSGPGGNGLDFSPLAQRIATFAEIADGAEAMLREHGRLRAAHSAVVRRIAAAVDQARGVPGLGALAREIAERLDLCRLARITAAVPVDMIRAALEALDALRARIEGALAAKDRAETGIDPSHQSDISVRHKDFTSEEFHPSDTCSGAVDERSRPDGRGSHSDAALRAGAEKKGSARAAPDQEKSHSAPAADVSIKAVLRAASAEMRACFSRSGEPDDWRALAAAAETLLPSLGVHPSAWRAAVAQMGLADAAICLAAIDRKHRLPPEDSRHVASPGGYLRAMTRRDRAGALAIERTIYGLAGSSSVR